MIPSHLTRALTHALSALRYGDRIRPTRDWFILLGLFFVALVAGTVWSVLFFLNVVSEEPTAQTAVSEVNDKTPLEQVRALFMTRDEEAARYRSEYRFVDPSR